MRNGTKATGLIWSNISLDVAEERLGKLTALKSSCLAHAPRDRASLNAKHTNRMLNDYVLV